MENKEGMKKMQIVGWGGLIGALIFFFNPDIGVFDLLPDFIGYILICAALTKIADIDDRVGEARELFVRMIYISLVKFAVFFVQFGFFPPTDQSVSTLMFAFVFSVAEIITVIPAMVKLADGILHLSSRHDGKAAYLPARARGARRDGAYEKTITERVRNATIAFVIIKALSRTLPEFSALSEQAYDESFWGQIYQYVGLFRIFGILVALIAAIVWIIPTVRYIRLMRGDAEFLSRLKIKYNEEILSQTDRLARRAVRSSFGYFGAAAVLTLDFYIDGFNILPDILSALCVIAGLLAIRKHIAGWRGCMAAAGLYGIVSLIADISKYFFNTNHYIEAIMKNEETYNAYILVCLLSAAAAAAFFAMVVLLLFIVLKDVINKHTGFSMTTHDTYNPSEKIQALHLALGRRLIIPAVIAALAAVMSIAAEVLVWRYDYLWIFTFLLVVPFAFFMIKILSEINEQISYKYMLS